MQSFLFETKPLGDETFKKIPGLHFFDNFLTCSEEDTAIKNCDRGIWENTLKRKVQHFGFRYDYQGKDILKKAPPVPAWMENLGRRISRACIRDDAEPNFRQVIVNNYFPGQGIGAHVDRTEHFGETLAVLSLGSDTGYRFCLPDYEKLGGPGNINQRSDVAQMVYRAGHIKEDIKMVLPARSLVIMTGPSRYLWMHEMPARKTDVIGGIRVARGRRISITYRVMNLKSD